jgi:hypothetical protein
VVSGSVELEEVARLSTAASPSAISAGDFDLDGKIDIAVAAVQGSQGIVQLFLGNGEGNFALVGTANDPCTDDVAGGCGLDHLPGPMTTAFLDADAAPDIVVAADALTCVGDCNDDGCVSTNEVTRINGMIGNPPASDCGNADGNRDGVVSLPEATQAENNRNAQVAVPPGGADDCDATKVCPNSFAKLTFLLSDNAPPTPTVTRTATGTQTATRTASGTPTRTGTATITGTGTGTVTRTRTPTIIPTKTCASAFCVQGDSCAVVQSEGGGNGVGFAPLFVAGLLAALRARALRSKE